MFAYTVLSLETFFVVAESILMCLFIVCVVVKWQTQTNQNVMPLSSHNLGQLNAFLYVDLWYNGCGCIS